MEVIQVLENAVLKNWVRQPLVQLPVWKISGQKCRKMWLGFKTCFKCTNSAAWEVWEYKRRSTLNVGCREHDAGGLGYGNKNKIHF